jgi:hypothetical protein
MRGRGRTAPSETPVSVEFPAPPRHPAKRYPDMRGTPGPAAGRPSFPGRDRPPPPVRRDRALPGTAPRPDGFPLPRPGFPARGISVFGLQISEFPPPRTRIPGPCGTAPCRQRRPVDKRMPAPRSAAVRPMSSPVPSSLFLRFPRAGPGKPPSLGRSARPLSGRGPAGRLRTPPRERPGPGVSGGAREDPRNRPAPQCGTGPPPPPLRGADNRPPPGGKELF